MHINSTTNRNTILFVCVTIIFICLSKPNCGNLTSSDNVEYKYMQPDYDLVQLLSTSDTICFRLSPNTYNSIKSFNLFTEKETEYIAFFDVRSSSINVYRLEDQYLEKIISLTNLFKNNKFYRTSVFVQNFDSIYVTNFSKLYLLDSTGSLNTSFDFLKDEENAIYATFEQTTPPIFKNGNLYTGVRPYVKDNSLKALKKWKVMYNFNFTEKQTTLLYGLPGIYKQFFYGYYFLDYSYCYNNRGNFVFSFPADSCIYESNLKDFNIAYFAKSIQNTLPVTPLTKKEVSDKDTSYKRYKLQDSYGPVYFDPIHKRYLRVFKPKIGEQAFNSKNRNRQLRFVIFDNDLRVIGESSIPGGSSYNSVFFTNTGKMFLRTRSANEYALYFVRFEYTDRTGSIHLTELNKHSDK